jgi:hypothetical protein
MDVMAGWKWIAGVTLAAACQRAPEDDVADTSESGLGSESGDDSASSTDASSADTGETSDVPAMESCWRWDMPATNSIQRLTALTGGDLVVIGSPAVIVRLSGDGEEVWTLNPQNVALQDVVALPDDGFAVMGSWQAGSVGFLRAYDDKGLATWQTTLTETIAYVDAWWSPERELLLALGATFEAPQVDVFELDGTLVETIPLGVDGSQVNTQSIAPLGDGFAVAGGVLAGDWQSYVAAYDAAGMPAWSLDGDDAYVEDVVSHDGSSLAIATTFEIAALDVDGTRQWAWQDGRESDPALAVADDGRVYASFAGRAPQEVIELSADGVVTALAFGEQTAFQTDITWFDGRVYVATLDQASHVDCWDPPG